MATTADLALAREALATHIYLTEDRLNHGAAMELLDAAMNVAFEVGRASVLAPAEAKEKVALRENALKRGDRVRAMFALAEQYRRADGSMDLPGPGSQYGAQLDKERTEAMKAAGVEYVP